jgi:hypothetical protein
MLSGGGAMPNAAQIRACLAEWLDGNTSLEEFEDWFVPETWNLHKENDLQAEDLANEIELSLSEYSGGYISRAKLEAELRVMANAIRPFEEEKRVPFRVPDNPAKTLNNAAKLLEGTGFQRAASNAGVPYLNAPHTVTKVA